MLVAHVLAWLVVLFLAIGPVYQGASVTAVAPGEIPNEPTRTTATLIQVNGWGVLPILLVPAALTGLALLTVLKTEAGQTRRTVLVWVLAALLLVFCALGSFSIGIFTFRLPSPWYWRASWSRPAGAGQKARPRLDNAKIEECRLQESRNLRRLNHQPVAGGDVAHRWLWPRCGIRRSFRGVSGHCNYSSYHFFRGRRCGRCFLCRSNDVGTVKIDSSCSRTSSPR